MSLELYYVAVPFFVWGVGVLTNYQIVKSSALNERWRLFDKVRAIRNDHRNGCEPAVRRTIRKRRRKHSATKEAGR